MSPKKLSRKPSFTPCSDLIYFRLDGHAAFYCLVHLAAVKHFWLRRLLLKSTQTSTLLMLLRLCQSGWVKLNKTSLNSSVPPVNLRRKVNRRLYSSTNLTL